MLTECKLLPLIVTPVTHRIVHFHAVASKVRQPRSAKVDGQHVQLFKGDTESEGDVSQSKALSSKRKDYPILGNLVSTTDAVGYSPLSSDDPASQKQITAIASMASTVLLSHLK